MVDPPRAVRSGLAGARLLRLPEPTAGKTLLASGPGLSASFSLSRVRQSRSETVGTSVKKLSERDALHTKPVESFAFASAAISAASGTANRRISRRDRNIPMERAGSYAVHQTHIREGLLRSSMCGRLSSSLAMASVFEAQHPLLRQ